MSMSARTRQSTWSTDAPEASGARNLGICFIGGLPNCFYRRPARGLPRGRAPAARAISSARLNSAPPRRPQLPQRRVEIAAGRCARVSLNASSLQEAPPEPRSVVGATRRPVRANSEGGSRAAFFVGTEDPLALVEVPSGCSNPTSHHKCSFSSD
jgi:hypothetical protein